MKKKQIIIAGLITAVVFYASSFLKGNTSYLQELTSITMIRGLSDDLSSKLAELGNPNVEFNYQGKEELKTIIQKELQKQTNLSFKPGAEHNLSVQVLEDQGNLSVSLELNKEKASLFSASRTLALGTWTSLLPPLLAIILAISLRRVILSISLAILLGSFIHYDFNIPKATWHAATGYFLGNFLGDFSLMILGFVFVLVGMVNIINRGGGMAGVINQITKIARCARTACVSAATMGLLIFFDDYTNCIVVGTTMRSFTDKMKVSREKLAYIVDSTTAPLAGLAIISTWIGFEVLQLHKMSEFMGIGLSGYTLFLKALPFRFYCIFTILFVFMVAFLRRDFGPMLHAERRAFLKGEVENPDSDHVIDPMIEAANPKAGVPARWFNAVMPVLSVVVFLFVGIFWRGSQLIQEAGLSVSIWSTKGLLECFLRIGGDGNTLFELMLFGAIFGTIVTIILLLSQKILGFTEIIKSFFSAWRILPAAIILVLAWAIRNVCDDLGTAFFIASLVKDILSPLLLPLVIFLVASAVSFATGTSFGTMGLLIPTVAPLAFIQGDPTLLVMTLGAVLDGAIFGDHCSPISDTTVLSSLSSACDLTDHVRTQMPYAILCMIVAAACGYIPAAYGIATPYLYGLGLLVLFAILWLIGRNPEQIKEEFHVRKNQTDQETQKNPKGIKAGKNGSGEKWSNCNYQRQYSN
ncbi:MAG: Na+/H+ antiporter NhaC family protein [Pseudomonadota bacterium]